MNYRQWRPGLPYSSVAIPRHNSRIGSAAVVSTVFEAGLPYSKKLSPHRSCVNALAFSRDGGMLASAGDDRKVLIWNFRPDSLDKPAVTMEGHRANIFCLDFSAGNRYIYSGSVDQSICKFDVGSSEGRLVSRFCQQNDSIRGVAAHPESDDVFLSASEDGTICLYDSRSSTQPVGTISRQIEVSDVRYHPLTGTLFISTDEVGRVLLHDARMAFENDRPGDGKMGAVLTYVTTAIRRPSKKLVHQNASSAVFDREGKRFVVTYMNTCPTLYETSDPYPLATFGGSLLPDGSPVPRGERTYSNNCTTKHGSFGGPGLSTDEYYTAGSDDFRAYVWKVPDVEELREKRRVVQKTAWVERDTETSVEKTIGFTRSRDNDVYVPVELNQPLFRLQGHDSIVNSSLIHPRLPHIVTAGVERHVVVHGPLGSSSPNSASEAQQNGFVKTSEEARHLPEDGEESMRRYARALLTGHMAVDEESDLELEEQKTIDFFDQCIRENLDIDPFDQARSRLSSDIDLEPSGDRDVVEENSSDEDMPEGGGDTSSDEMVIDDD